MLMAMESICRTHEHPSQSCPAGRWQYRVAGSMRYAKLPAELSGGLSSELRLVPEMRFVHPYSISLLAIFGLWRAGVRLGEQVLDCRQQGAGRLGNLRSRSHHLIRRLWLGARRPAKYDGCRKVVHLESGKPARGGRRRQRHVRKPHGDASSGEGVSRERRARMAPRKHQRLGHGRALRGAARRLLCGEVGALEPVHVEGAEQLEVEKQLEQTRRRV